MITQDELEMFIDDLIDPVYITEPRGGEKDERTDDL